MEPSEEVEKKKKIVVQVGEEWPNDVTWVSSEEQEKMLLGRRLATFFMVLLCVLLVYGMVVRDSQILEAILNLVLSGIGFACGWAWGRSP